MVRKVLANWRKLFLALAVLVAAGPETAGAQSAGKRIRAKVRRMPRTARVIGDGPAGQVMTPPPAPFRPP